MGAFRNILFGAITLAIAFSYQAYRDLTKSMPKPELGEEVKSTSRRSSLDLGSTFSNSTEIPRTFSVSLSSDVNEFWGRGDGRNYKEDKTIKPFKISYSAEVDGWENLLKFPTTRNIFSSALGQVIKRLADKLDDARTFTDSLEDTAFEYGFNSKRLQQILSYWRGQYLPKWGEREEFLNQFPQFTTQIQGWEMMGSSKAWN
jgi:Epoxide hydrolase N terminus